VFEDARYPEDRLASLMSANGSTRADAVRRTVAGVYRMVLRTHPAVDPDMLLVDLTDTGDGIRIVVHDGCHVPSVLTARNTRRYHIGPWMALGASF
jgi:hypothetical protein